MPLYAMGSPALAVLRSRILALSDHAPTLAVAAVGLGKIERIGDSRIRIQPGILLCDLVPERNGVAIMKDDERFDLQVLGCRL